MAFNVLQKILPPILYAKLSKKRKKVPAGALKPKILNEKKALRQAIKPAKISFGWYRLILSAVALSLAFLGQLDWAKVDQALVLQGWIYFGLATLIFIATLWPWKWEGLRDAPLPKGAEKYFLVSIFLVAVFFRVFRLDEMPPGIFFDQGFMGWAAERILHNGYHPFFTDEVFRNPPLVLYQLALWMAFFSISQAHLFLFFVFLSLVSLGFIYWTFRQLAGPRVALLALFVLAVMRWHVSFSRNGFPTIQVPLYMFATMAFLLHGLKTGKRWVFYTAGTFFALGLYTYQAYKIFPILLLVLGLYEWFHNRQAVVKNVRNLLAFAVVFFLLISPLAYQTVHSGSLGWREDNFNIYANIRQSHSLKPLVDMIWRTGMMFNRMGDNNERHNLPNYKMLDDVTACLFVLGLFFGLFRIARRKYFVAVVGFLFMCLPCILSQDAAHANRMLGTTPFIAFLAALPIAAIWGRVRERWGGYGEVLFLVVLTEPFLFMAFQNYHDYFELQAHSNSMWSTGVWAGYSVPETKIGETIMAQGEKDDYYLMPRFYNYPTINFLSYNHQERVKKMVMPAYFAPLATDKGRGIYYAMIKDHSGVMGVLKELYPGGHEEQARNPKGEVMVDYFIVPPEAVTRAKGMDGRINGQEGHFPDFPTGLPDGPFRAVFKGCFYVDAPGQYYFDAKANGSAVLKVAGRLVSKATQMDLAQGFYSLEIDLAVGAGHPDLKLAIQNTNGQNLPLDSSCLVSLPLNRGLKGSWYYGSEPSGLPAMVRWCPTLNYPHGDDFAPIRDPMCIHWTGTLNAPRSGRYDFAAFTDDGTKLVIDGRKVFEGTGYTSGSIQLLAGPHSIDVDFSKKLGPIFSLEWKTPGSINLRDIPMEAFGPTR